MVVSKIKVELKDKSSCILRNPIGEDAEQIIQFLIDSAKESEFLIRTPEEINTSKEREIKKVEWVRKSEEELVLLAEKDGMIVGIITIGAIGNRRKVKHRGSFSIAVRRNYQNIGIGKALLDHALVFIKKVNFNF